VLISPLKLQPKDVGCQIAKIVQGILPYSDSRSVKGSRGAGSKGEELIPILYEDAPNYVKLIDRYI
jgi:hypothetical protein